MANERSTPRIELYVQVEIPRDGGFERVVAHDLSEGGAFLAMAPDERTWLQPGVTMDVILDAGDDEAAEGDDARLKVRARVARRETAGPLVGVGVAFLDIDDDTGERIRRMLERARIIRPARRF